MRLQEEFRTRTKRYAAGVIRLYASLPKGRREIEVLGHQLLRSGTSVAAHVREASRARSTAERSRWVASDVDLARRVREPVASESIQLENQRRVAGS